MLLYLTNGFSASDRPGRSRLPSPPELIDVPTNSTPTLWESSRSKSASSAKRCLADYDAVFSALDSGARRQILMVLHFRGDKMTSGEIADRFSCAWPTTSRHLRKLENAGLVEVQRSGREWIYRLNRKRLAVVTQWLDWFARKDEIPR